MVIELDVAIFLLYGVKKASALVLCSHSGSRLRRYCKHCLSLLSFYLSALLRAAWGVQNFKTTPHSERLDGKDDVRRRELQVKLKVLKLLPLICIRGVFGMATITWAVSTFYILVFEVPMVSSNTLALSGKDLLFLNRSQEYFTHRDGLVPYEPKNQSFCLGGEYRHSCFQEELQVFGVQQRSQPATETITLFARTIFERSMVIIRLAERRQQWRDALAIILHPLSLISWVSIASWLVMLLFLWLITVWRASRSLHPSTLIRFVLGEPDIGAAAPNHRVPESLGTITQDSARLYNRFSMTTVVFSVKVLFAATVILWEIGLAYVLFEQQSKPGTLSINNLHFDQLKKFTVRTGGFAQFAFERTVDPLRLYANRTAPWQRCETLDECIGQVLNKTNQAERLFVSGFEVRRKMSRMRACDKLEVFRMEPSPGFLNMGTNLAHVGRRMIEREVEMLQMENTVAEMQKDIFGDSISATCDEPWGRKISLLTYLLFVLLAPLVIVAAISLLVACVLERIG